MVVPDGSLASTVPGKLAVGALGSGAVKVLVASGLNASDGDVETAKQVVDTEPNVAYDVVDIESVVTGLIEETPGVSVNGDESVRTVVDNAGARIRPAAAYLLANADERMVVGSRRLYPTAARFRRETRR